MNKATSGNNRKSPAGGGNISKGLITEIEIFDLSTEGQGIGRAGGLVVFVKGTVPGDKARVQITKVKKNYAFAKLLEITEVSAERVSEPICEYSGECGGCPYAGLKYSAQLSVKENQVKQKLERIAGIEFAACTGENASTNLRMELEGEEADPRAAGKEPDGKNSRVLSGGYTNKSGDAEKRKGVPGSDTGSFLCPEYPVFHHIVGMQEDDNEYSGCYHYRDKASMAVSTGGLMTRKGGIQVPVHEPRIGYMKPKSGEAVDCLDCTIQAPPAVAAAEALREFMRQDNITSYDKRWDKGLMKSMTVKTAFGTGEVMVILEINGKGIPNAAKLIQMLDDAIYESGIEEGNPGNIKSGSEIEHESQPYDEIDDIPEKRNDIAAVYVNGSEFNEITAGSGNETGYNSGNEIGNESAESVYSLESVVIKTTKKNGDEEFSVLAGKSSINDIVYLEEFPLICSKPTAGESAEGGSARVYREMRFEISPPSFYQVNYVQMQRLYSIVRRLLINSYGFCEEFRGMRANCNGITADQDNDIPASGEFCPGRSNHKSKSDKPTVLDLYCGIGTIGLCLADLCEQVVGIETVEEAVIDANRNAVINGIVNARYICGKAENIIPSCMSAGSATPGFTAPGKENIFVKASSSGHTTHLPVTESAPDEGDCPKTKNSSNQTAGYGGADCSKEQMMYRNLREIQFSDNLTAGGDVPGASQAHKSYKGNKQNDCNIADNIKIDRELKELIRSADTAIMDPPRAGCSPDLLKALSISSVKNIIYISCDPATLARDIKILGESGFRLIEVTPVDMFPHTAHVETVTSLVRK